MLETVTSQENRRQLKEMILVEWPFNIHFVPLFKLQDSLSWTDKETRQKQEFTDFN